MPCQGVSNLVGFEASNDNGRLPIFSADAGDLFSARTEGCQCKLFTGGRFERNRDSRTQVPQERGTVFTASDGQRAVEAGGDRSHRNRAALPRFDKFLFGKAPQLD